MRGLYVHIPFCKTICNYCDFPKRIAKKEIKEEYINNLLLELKSYENELKNIKTVYIGGGTPNSLELGALERLLNNLKPYLYKSIENTIEINPELLTEEQVQLFKKYNINRISIGAQTFNSKILKLINRHHNITDIIKSINMLQDAGINNINVDMMYGLPSQTMKDLKEDIDTLLELNIKHISYYSLILEEKTVIDYQLKHNLITLPDDDLVADMADYLAQRLELTMFNRYEISNYSYPGFESKHNLLYWNCEEYIGIGAGACGYFNNIRYQNNHILSKYYNEYILDKEFINQNESKKEYMMLGLRKISGINVNDYYSKFKTYPNHDFDIDKLINLGLIDVKNNFIRIKKDKINLGNLVFEEFVGD